MRNIAAILLIYLLSAQAVILSGQAVQQPDQVPPAFQETAEAVAHDPTFAQAYVGICVMDGNGKVLYKDREFVGIDEDAINAWTMEQSKKLWGQLNNRVY